MKNLTLIVFIIGLAIVSVHSARFPIGTTSESVSESTQSSSSDMPSSTTPSDQNQNTIWEFIWQIIEYIFSLFGFSLN